MALSREEIGAIASKTADEIMKRMADEERMAAICKCVCEQKESNPSTLKEAPAAKELYEARLWRKWANMDDVSRTFATEKEAYDYLAHLKYIAKAGDKITIKRSQEWDIKVLYRETIDRDGHFWTIRKPYEPIPTEPIGGSRPKEREIKKATVKCPICGKEIEIPEYNAVTRSEALRRHTEDEHSHSPVRRTPAI